MPSALPEDIQTELKRDFVRGIDSFRGGGSMPIGGLVLYKNLRDRRFEVQCYSSKYFAQNITRVEAEERIATAKEELAQLFRLFPELEAEVSGLDLGFYFCHDPGKSVACFATELNGLFTYYPQET